MFFKEKFGNLNCLVLSSSEIPEFNLMSMDYTRATRKYIKFPLYTAG